MYVSPVLFDEYITDRRGASIVGVVRGMYIMYGQHKTNAWLDKLLIPELACGWWQLFRERVIPRCWAEALDYRDDQMRKRPLVVDAEAACEVCHRKHRLHAVDKKNSQLVVLCEPRKFGTLWSPPGKSKRK